jgi:hypothetical protein
MTDHTNAQRQARWRQRQKARIAILESAFKNDKKADSTLVRELAAKLSKAETRIAELENALKTSQGQATVPARKPKAAVARVTPDMLSMTAQQKLETAIRQHKQKLTARFEIDVRKEVNERIEMVAQRLRVEQKEARRIMESRKGIMKRDEYRKILACLHPDRVNQFITDPKLRQTYDEAWHIVRGLEKMLLKEKDSPTEFTGIPKTMAEWDELRRKSSEARKAARAGLAKRRA